MLHETYNELTTELYELYSVLVANRFNTVLSKTKSEAFSLLRIQTSTYFKVLLSIINSIFTQKPMKS